MGFDTQNTLLLAMPTGIVSWLSSLVWGYVAVKSKQRALSAIGSVILPLIGVILLVVVPRSNQGGSLLGVYLAAMYWGSYIVVMGIMYANTGGYTKKMTVYAVAYIGYCVGNIVKSSPLSLTLLIARRLDHKRSAQIKLRDISVEQWQ